MEQHIKILLVDMILVASTHVTTCDVISSRFDPCLTEYFFNQFYPRYLYPQAIDLFQPNETLICQKINGRSYFFTRYSTWNKIPIYSAYKFRSFRMLPNPPTRFYWRIERNLPITDQSSNRQFVGSGLHKGHLNPRSFNMYDTESIRATFTLTNAVPMYPQSNWNWYRVAENPLRQRMKNNCNYTNSERYIITGVIPGMNQMRGVNIPDYIWTAACCDNQRVVQRGTQSWSIGYLMNTTNISYQDLSIPQLEMTLSSLLNSRVQLFDNFCR